MKPGFPVPQVRTRAATRRGVCRHCACAVLLGDRIIVLTSSIADVDVLHAISHSPDCAAALLRDAAGRTGEAA
jgi:hypothetical protein